MHKQLQYGTRVNANRFSRLPVSFSVGIILVHGRILS